MFTDTRFGHPARTPGDRFAFWFYRPEPMPQFFLTAVAHQARDAVQRAERLVRLREEYLQEAAVSRSRLSAVVDLLFTNPYITAGRVEREVGLTNQGAHNLLRQAERLGWISEAGRFGQGGRVYWVATDVRDVIEATVPL